MNKSRIMHDMTVREIREGLKEMKTIIVPIAVVEQHGYHLPVSVDIHNAVELARRASDLSGCFVAPPLNYSFSGGMLPGTINISPQVVSLIVMDICTSLENQGFRNILLLLGHGGTENTKAIRDAAENFQRLHPKMEGITVSVVPFWELSPTYMKSFEERDYHAGFYETSMMLYWKPELVKMDAAKFDSPEILSMMRNDPDAYVVRTREVDSEFVIPRMVQHSEIEVGVMGDYTGANAEVGKRIADECAAGLAALVEKLEKRHRDG